MSSLSIPATIDHVTPEWMTAMFRAAGVLGPDASVVALATEQVGAGVGIMGLLHRVVPTYVGPAVGAPASVVIKQASPYEANKAQGVALGLYVAETRFYNELAGSTSLRVPRVFCSQLADNHDFVIVMEDLSGLDMPDQTIGMSPDQMTHAVVALADLHGPFWGRVGHLEWLPSVVHPRIEGFAAAFPPLWEVVKERFAAQLDPARIAVGDAVARHYLAVMTRLASLPWTLLHMDFRCDNFLFDPANPTSPLVTLDWQSLGRGPGVYDLNYLIGGSMTLADRRAHQDRLLSLYLERLGTHGVTDYSREQLDADFALASLTGMGPAVLVGGGLDMANERGVALIASMVERHFALPADLNAVALIS